MATTIPRTRRELADDPRKRDVVEALFENYVRIARTLRGLTITAEDGARYCGELLGRTFSVDTTHATHAKHDADVVHIKPAAPNGARVHVVRASKVKHPFGSGGAMDDEPEEEPGDERAQAAVRAKGLKKGTRDIIALLRVYAPHALSRQELALRIGCAARGTSFAKYASQARTSGIVREVESDSALLELTPEAEAIIADHPHLAVASRKKIVLSASEIADLWAKKLKRGSRDILDVLIAEGRQKWTTFETLAEVCGGIDPKGTSLAKYVSQLRAPGLIETAGRTARVSSALYIEKGAH